MRPASQWNPPSREVKAIAEACRQRITSIVPRARVILYGSRARDDARPESDYDLLVLLPDEAGEADERAIDEALYALELQKGAVVSTLIFPQATWSTPLYRAMPFHEAVDREGVLL
jgi:predicted nucleotidyltransferase